MSVDGGRPVAVILAAGMGSRLQSVHADAPKGFVEIDDVPIIERSVAAIRAAGVNDFVVVAGWMADHYRRWSERQVSTTCVLNPEFATTGSLASLLIGCADLAGRDVLVVESDLLYDPTGAIQLMAAPSADTLLVSGFTESRDEVWVYGDGARLQQLSKKAWGDRQPLGELVGLTRLSADTISALVNAAHDLLPSAHYEDGLNAVVERREIALLRIPDLAWCEIDDADHLARARAAVWPRIAARAGTLTAGAAR